MKFELDMDDFDKMKVEKAQEVISPTSFYCFQKTRKEKLEAFREQFNIIHSRRTAVIAEINRKQQIYSEAVAHDTYLKTYLVDSVVQGSCRDWPANETGGERDTTNNGRS